MQHAESAGSTGTPAKNLSTALRRLAWLVPALAALALAFAVVAALLHGPR